MSGIKGMHSGLRGETSQLTLRVDISMLYDLKLLYAYEKKQYGMVSFNRWVVIKLSEALDKKKDILELVKGRLAELEQRRNVV